MDEETTLLGVIKGLAAEAYDHTDAEMCSVGDILAYLDNIKYTPDIIYEDTNGKEHKVKDGGFFVNGGVITIKQN